MYPQSLVGGSQECGSPAWTWWWIHRDSGYSGQWICCLLQETWARVFMAVSLLYLFRLATTVIFENRKAAINLWCFPFTCRIRLRYSPLWPHLPFQPFFHYSDTIAWMVPVFFCLGHFVHTVPYSSHALPLSAPIEMLLPFKIFLHRTINETNSSLLECLIYLGNIIWLYTECCEG